MADTKAVLFSTSNATTLSREQVFLSYELYDTKELKSMYDYYCQFPSENRFGEIEKVLLDMK